jgi:hypothetical protein
LIRGKSAVSGLAREHIFVYGVRLKFARVVHRREQKYEDFLWISSTGDQRSGNMQIRFGKGGGDPIPFILTVTPAYVANKIQKTLPINIIDIQNYCDKNKEDLRKIAFNCKQRGKNSDFL